MKYYRLKSRLQSGFTLIELLIVLAISAAAYVAIANAQLFSLRQHTANGAAAQINSVGIATQAYIANNLTALNAQAAGNFPMTITVTTLKSATSCGTVACLASTVPSTNLWGANYTISLRRAGTSIPYSYEFLAVTSANGAIAASYEIGGVTQLAMVTTAAQASPANVGWTWVPLSGGAPQASTQSFVGMTQANYPAIVAGPHNIGGQLAYYYTTLGTPPPLYDGYYLRLDGTNTMSANLNVGGHGVYGVSYGINNPSITTPGSIATSNDFYMANSTASGNSTITGNSTVTGNSAVTGTATVTGNVSLGGGLALTSNTGDITMAQLTSSGHLTNSIASSIGRVVTLTSVGVSNGSTLSVPTCAAGGTAIVYIVPSSMTGAVTNGNFGYIFKATGPTAGLWAVVITDELGNIVIPPTPPSYSAIGQTGCQY